MIFPLPDVVYLENRIHSNLVLAHCVEIYSLMAAAAHLSQMP